MSSSLIAAVFLCLCVSTSLATTGFDLSYFQGDVSQSSFNCLKSDGYVFGIIEATAGTGGFNSHIGTDISRAHAAGIANVDVYIFPNTKQSASSSMTTLINQLKSAGALTKNMIWMDIEGSQYWSSSCSTNQQWLSQAISTIDGLYKGCGKSTCVGIYTSSSQWSPIMCGSSQFSKYQLWYAHYDNSASFSDFSSFGGWTKPAMKQYAGTTNICSTSIDKDYY
eukprot:CAMPEP_0184644944 /NCGR_PEP_ID=MMETSP0308-20130426/1533_1 /TAXON_ID=38269 /ORGANISM="Gloeochaete witrockiana, Strain SAG 46.84" /LENGTH=222 /DNA_ID=CAMNT_0027073693 /DNA_START=30 /DNA_END=698 /DNA_ORIENTATION=+